MYDVSRLLPSVLTPVSPSKRGAKWANSTVHHSSMKMVQNQRLRNRGKLKTYDRIRGDAKGWNAWAGRKKN